MKPLRQQSSASPLIAKAQQLIESAGEIDDSPAHVARMRVQLDARGGILASVRRAPALVLAGCLMLFGASAFAAVRYLAAPERAREPVSAPVRAHRAPSPEAAAPAAEPIDAPARTAPAQPPHGPEEEAIVPASATRSEDEAAARAPARAHGPRAGRSDARSRSTRGDGVRAQAHADGAQLAAESQELQAGAAADEPPIENAKAQKPAAEAPDSESALVHRAVRALRRSGDPQLAATLLAQSQRRYPDGPLAEEALSLQIEAAQALDDATAARAFARQYLARYPQGRYRAAASRALRAEAGEGSAQ